jgi:hypothetical protein
VKAALADNGGFKSIFDAERSLSDGANAKGWGATLISRLCYDVAKGRILDKCERDDVTESYLNSKTQRVKLSAQLPPAFAGATCNWTFGTDTGPKNPDVSCATVVERRFKNGTPTLVRVVARNQAGQTAEATSVVDIRDVLIVGMGDSIASGEGNPVVPVELSDQGFCFRRMFTGDQFYLPGRARANVAADCPLPGEHPDQLDAWNKAAASWLFNACHRSIYGYQTRTALTLAIENKHISVTYLPLGCTGATINVGVLGSQPARERPVIGSKQGPRDVEAQVTQLKNYLRKGNTNALFRRPDAILLTIGANDIGFSGLVANIIVTEDPERALLKSKLLSLISDPAAARLLLKKSLPADFAKLRKALIPFTDTSLSRVVYTTYANPGMSNGGTPCGASRIGFDAHPAFSVDKNAVAATVKFVEGEFVPALKSMATCESSGGCSNPAAQTMSYVEGHRAAFADHGFCALQEQPDFDRLCFRDGDSFQGPAHGLEKPLACDLTASSFRPYAKRSRWIRTVNDSFFAAMTYSSMGLLLTPTDIHDALWGLVSVVYGGAIHPTAEGHATMADSTIVAARKVLGLTSPSPLVAAK